MEWQLQLMLYADLIRCNGREFHEMEWVVVGGGKEHVEKNLNTMQQFQFSRILLQTLYEISRFFVEYLFRCGALKYMQGHFVWCQATWAFVA